MPQTSEKRSVAAVPAAPRPRLRRFLLLFLWGVLAEISAAVFFLDAAHPGGMLILLYGPPIYWGPRLIPLAALLLGAAGFAATSRATGLEACARSLAAFFEAHRRAGWLLVGAGFAGALIAVWVLRAFPNSSDEYDYLFEAKTFLAGRLWNPAPPFPDLFAFYNLAIWKGKWFSLYLPGWPLLMAAVMALRLPSWLASPLAAGLLLFVVLKLGQRRDGPLGGILAVALLALSAFFLFNAGSYFDLVPAAAAGALFCWAALAFLDTPRLTNAAAAGAALGVLGLMRPQDVILFGLPFAAQFLWRAGRRHYRIAPAIILAGLPFLAALLLYNKATTGSPIPYFGGPFPNGIFGRPAVDALGHPLPPLNGVHLAVARLIMLAEWTSPLLVLGYFAAFAFVLARRRTSFLDFIFPVYVLGFIFVPFDGGNQYGPRYYFEGFPFLVLTVVSALVPVLREARGPRLAGLAASLTLAHGAIALAGVAVHGFFMRAIIDERMDIYDQVQARHLKDAVVVVDSTTSPLQVMWRRELTRDGIDIDRPVLYVRDLPDQLKKLHRLLPDRRFYIYERAPRSVKGSLRRLR